MNRFQRKSLISLGFSFLILGGVSADYNSSYQQSQYYPYDQTAQAIDRGYDYYQDGNYDYYSPAANDRAVVGQENSYSYPAFVQQNPALRRQFNVLGDGLLAVVAVALAWGVGGGLVTYVTSQQRAEIRSAVNSACTWVTNVGNVPTPPALDTTYSTPTLGDSPTALTAVKNIINGIRDNAASLLPQCQHIDRIQFPGL